MMRKFYEWFFGQDPIIEEVDDVEKPHDIQYVTYMFGGNLSEWEGTT